MADYLFTYILNDIYVVGKGERFYNFLSVNKKKNVLLRGKVWGVNMYTHVLLHKINDLILKNFIKNNHHPISKRFID